MQQTPRYRKDVKEDGWNTEYFAAEGDTLAKLALQYKIDKHALQESNYPEDSDCKLRIDAKLAKDYALWMPSRLYRQIRSKVAEGNDDMHQSGGDSGDEVATA